MGRKNTEKVKMLFVKEGLIAHHRLFLCFSMLNFFFKKSNTFTQGLFSLPLFALKKVMLEKVAAAGHLSRRWFFFSFFTVLQPLLCKMNPGGHCFCQRTDGQALEEWMSINDCLTDSCMNAAIISYLAADWLSSWMTRMNAFRFVKLLVYNLWALMSQSK